MKELCEFYIYHTAAQQYAAQEGATAAMSNYESKSTCLLEGLSSSAKASLKPGGKLKADSEGDNSDH